LNRAGFGLESGFSPISITRTFRGVPVVADRRLCDDVRVSVRVLIVDDHPAFRASARLLLEEDGFTVCGEAHDGASTLELARRLRPDLVLLDIGLPDASGFEIAETLAAERFRVVLVSSREQHELGRRLPRSSAVGFVPKHLLSAAALHSLLEAT
jgi:DNA-binding NarL/FixJ family response regulator